MNPQIVGSLILAVPALAVAWAAVWPRNRAVFWFALVMILVGTGYLNATGAARDIGVRFGGTSATAPSPSR